MLQTRLRKAKSRPAGAVTQASPSQRPLLIQASQVAHRAQLWCLTLHYHRNAGKTQLKRTECRLNSLSLSDSTLRVTIPCYRGTTRQPRVGHGSGRGAGHCGRAGAGARGSPGPSLWGSTAEAPAHCACAPSPATSGTSERAGGVTRGHGGECGAGPCMGPSDIDAGSVPGLK